MVAALPKQSFDFDYDRFRGLLKAWYYPGTGRYLLVVAGNDSR